MIAFKIAMVTATMLLALTGIGVWLSRDSSMQSGQPAPNLVPQPKDKSAKPLEQEAKKADKMQRAKARCDSDCCPALKTACDEECDALSNLVVAHVKLHDMIHDDCEDDEASK